MYRIFFLHHKCGSRYILRIIKEVCDQLKLPIFLNECQPDGISAFENSNYFEFKKLNLTEFKGIHIIRDPRDIIISGYFSHKFSHSLNSNWGQNFLKFQREKLLNLSLEDGLNLEIETGYSLSKLSHWNYNQPQILEIKFEKIISSPVNCLKNIFNFIDIQGIDFNEIHERINFTTLSKGRKLGEEKMEHHYRKGVPGDWKNYFSLNNKNYFKEKWPGLTEKLKYTENDLW